MKTRWLNVMLHFSGVINRYKLRVIETTGPKVILYAFWVLVLEIVNILISLPAYAFISSQEFAGSDPSAITTYRLRRVVSLSVLAGMTFSVFVWILVSFFGLILFPHKSQASFASWDFNTPLAYNYDTTKIQITDGTAIFKAQVSAPAPMVEPVPVPVVEPAPAPAPAPGPLLFNYLRQLFESQVAYAQTNTCSATLQTITPLVVTPFVKWTGFSETANKNGGEIYYTLSGDGGQSWLYFDGNNWSPALGHGNTASEINDHISNFPITLSQTGAGTLMFKATFESDCSHDVSLLSLTADYQDQPSVIASFTSPETSTATSTTVLTSEADPAVVAITDSVTASTSVSLTTDTTIDTGVATPIAFSVHIVTETTGNPGHTLYSIPGLLSVSEGPDNGLVIHVTNTNLQTTTLSYPDTSPGSSANVAVGNHIVVLVYDGTTLKLYIDGAVVASLTTPIVIAPPANVSTSIGCVSAGFVLEALTLAQINANYLQCSNQAPTLNITGATQKADDGFVDIIYTATDVDNDFVSIPLYEYSTSGDFVGEESVMTVANLDAEHDGVSGIATTENGIPYTFVWNAKADLPNYAGNVYVRLRANDSLITGPVETFYPVRVDTKAPVISSFVGTQTNDGDTVTLTYTLSETSTPVSTVIALSEDGATWMEGATTFNANDLFPNFEGAIIARITATDTYDNQSVTTTDVDLDTRAPIGLSALAGVESNTNQILWHWSPADDSNFDRYIITYGTNSESVTNGSVNNSTNVSLWGPSRDSDLLLAGTDRTVITGLVADTLYYAKITAYDDYGHEVSSFVASFKTEAETVQAEVPLSEASTLLPPAEPISEIISNTVEIEAEVEVNSGAGSTGGGGSVSVGGGSGGAGNSSVISLTTNESQTASGNSDPVTSNSSGQSGSPSPEASTNRGITSSFVPTADSVLQNIPELKGLAESRESGVLAKPQVTLVEKSLTGQTINFTGTGIPKAKIALFIHSDQVVVHTTDADAEGKWSFSHDQRELELAEGEHTVFAVTYDPGSKVKSKPSLVSTFYVKKSPAAAILAYTNLPTTLLTLVVLLFGTLYIYSRRKKRLQ